MPALPITGFETCPAPPPTSIFVSNNLRVIENFCARAALSMSVISSPLDRFFLRDDSSVGVFMTELRAEELMVECLDTEKGEGWNWKVEIWGDRKAVEPEDKSCLECWLSIWRKILSLILLLILPLLPTVLIVLVWDIIGSDMLDGRLFGCTELVPAFRLVPASNEHLMAWKSDL